MCCCGGRNHGRGLEQAVAQTRALAHDMIPSEWKQLGEPSIPVLGLSEQELQESISSVRCRRRRWPIRPSGLRGIDYMRPLIVL